MLAGRQVGIYTNVAQGTVLVATEDGDARRHGAIQIQTERQAGANHDAFIKMRRKSQRGEKSHPRSDAVMPARLPGMFHRLEIYQSDHRHDDDGSQHRLRQVVKQRSEKQQRHQNNQRRDHRTHARFGPGIHVDRGTRERSGYREGLGEAADYVGQPLTDQLLVWVESLPGLCRDGLGNRDGLHEAHQRDHQRRRQQ